MQPELLRPQPTGVSNVVLVLLQQTDRLGECVAAEGVAQLARAHDLDDAGLALVI